MPRRPIDEQYSFVYSSRCPFPTSVSDPGTFTPCRPVGKKSSPTAPSGLVPWLMIPYMPRRCDRPTGSGTFFGPRFIVGFMSSGLAARDMARGLVELERGIDAAEAAARRAWLLLGALGVSALALLVSWLAQRVFA